METYRQASIVRLWQKFSNALVMDRFGAAWWLID